MSTTRVYDSIERMPLLDDVEEAISKAYGDRRAEWLRSPSNLLNDAVGYWTMAVLDAFWQLHKHESDDDGCNGAYCHESAAWEPAWSEEYSRTARTIERDLMYRARTLLHDMVERFAAEHPEATRR